MSRNERVEVEVWYRAPYRDAAGREAFGMPYLVGFVKTRTEVAKPTAVAPQLPHFDIPGEGFRLHPGCYVGRIRIAAAVDERPTQTARLVEHVGEVERCATASRPSLP
jgi:hypothetical protein